MKKLVAAVLVTGLAFSGVNAGSASAASGNSIQSVDQLQQGDTTLEGAKLGSSIQSVLKNNSKPIYSHRPDGKEHYYEFKQDDGVLVVTTNGKKNEGKITRVSMSYNDTDGPSYKEVTEHVSHNAITREHYNNVTGNFGYIQDDDVSYQFSSASPSDKDIKLYRIDISK
ncbi:hypothetical protein CW746_00165 [Staphylococcus succinus]|uniref:SA0570 family protein n=1 Tax=Staphylococcus TaxID=1279 RepID=UPI00062BE732|nr:MULTISPECIES: hypothetical protein [Staphylococcus]MBU0436819.1 hypothetical protein [Staphylococcus succinus]MDH9161825.1 hypothetical protein [Staphylococcus succinus]MEB7462214.1 hypothetical protein [Staphylococcus succinus]MEB8125082.1 hypothetical protein [Staphylococcus succinus]OIJ30019.1 hypothetical protein BK821_05510 [Staphylococcus sp. LCT-H4]